MKLSFDVELGRLIKHDEIIQHSTGSQVVPAGGIILTLKNGIQLGFDRAYFDTMFPDVNVGSDGNLYTESESPVGDWPQLPGAAAIPSPHPIDVAARKDLNRLVDEAKDRKDDKKNEVKAKPYPAEDLDAPLPADTIDTPAPQADDSVRGRDARLADEKVAAKK